ncbi:MAG: CapA family protein [candidate division WOR-3 bacterium]|nr:CapA family protein [candidate division WOR-3 bacterium]MCX7947326.1 CapA family protein [candidate division WOR-3 bacterium]MDW8150118.1 CapA family protein [candidate division WOR-3 bacterium]
MLLFIINLEEIKIMAVGDIMLGSPYPNASRMPPNDGKDLLKPAYSIFSKGDIVFGNLEGPFYDSGSSVKCSDESARALRCFAFRMPSRYAIYLKEAGFNILSLANNHIMDFGMEGVRHTQRLLDSLGINYCGIGKEMKVMKVKDLKIGFLCFNHNPISLNINDIEGARKVVRENRDKVDILIVSFHGGAEGSSRQRVPYETEYFYGEKRGNLRVFSRAVIDEGADLVIGHGPHVLRGMEIYKDRLIAYSLGNFLTYGWFNLSGPQSITAILEVKVDKHGKFLEGKIYPFKLEGLGILKEDNTNSAIKIIKQLSELDFKDTYPNIFEDGTIKPR